MGVVNRHPFLSKTSMKYITLDILKQHLNILYETVVLEEQNQEVESGTPEESQEENQEEIDGEETQEETPEQTQEETPEETQEETPEQPIQYTAEDQYLMMLWDACLDAVAKYIDDDIDRLATANDGNLPSALLQATLLLVGNYYNSRESNTFTQVHEIPNGFTFLCDLYRNYAGNSATAQEVIDDLTARVEALEEYQQFDSSRTIISDGTISVSENSGTTTLEVDELDGGEY